VLWIDIASVESHWQNTATVLRAILKVIDSSTEIKWHHRKLQWRQHRSHDVITCWYRAL